MKNQKVKMENFKINDYNTNEQYKKSLEQENSFEEFQDFKFDSFESLSSEQQKEIEESQESSKKEALENLNDIYARTERSADRENNSFFLHEDEIRNMHITHFEDYGANFKTYEGHGDKFILRENQFKTQEQLVQEISTIKSIPREISAGKRFSNIIRAISGKIAA